MKYKITHTTIYNYETPVRVCHNLVMLTPRADARVRIHSHRLRINPTPDLLHQRIDFFGNHLHAFSIDESHRQLRVTSMMQLRVFKSRVPDLHMTPAWESIVRAVAMAEDSQWLTAVPYLFDSRRIERGSQFAEYAYQDFTAGRPVAQCASELMGRIHREFVYDPTATFVNTLPQETLTLKRGVCQDFAQLAISCLRSVGLAARYVSGYLRTVPAVGTDRLVGADQSHAWVSVYCGEQAGWIEFDPTNNCLCAQDHVPIAWGRDYQDVVPVRGVFLGGGQHALKVSVDVEPVA